MEYVEFYFPNTHWTERKAIHLLSRVWKTTQCSLFSISHFLKEFLCFVLFEGGLLCCCFALSFFGFYFACFYITWWHGVLGLCWDFLVVGFWYFFWLVGWFRLIFFFFLEGGQVLVFLRGRVNRYFFIQLFSSDLLWPSDVLDWSWTTNSTFCSTSKRAVMAVGLGWKSLYPNIKSFSGLHPLSFQQQMKLSFNTEGSSEQYPLMVL